MYNCFIEAIFNVAVKEKQGIKNAHSKMSWKFALVWQHACKDASHGYGTVAVSPPRISPVALWTSVVMSRSLSIPLGLQTLFEPCACTLNIPSGSNGIRSPAAKALATAAMHNGNLNIIPFANEVYDLISASCTTDLIAAALVIIRSYAQAFAIWYF